MGSSTEQEQGFSEFESNLDLLMQVPFFAVMPVEALKVLAYLCSREVFKAGDYVFQQEEEDGHAYYIMEGKAALLRDSGAGEERLREFGDGVFLGGLSLLSTTKRLFSLRAETPLSCMVLAEDGYRKTLAQFPDVLPEVLKEVCAQIYRWEFGLIVQHADICPHCKSVVGVTLI